MLSVSNIVNRANNSLCCVSNQPTLKCIAELSGIVNALCNGSISSTSSFSTLPSAGLNKGRMIFLNNENFYVYSDGVQWSNNFCTVSSATSTVWVWGYNFGILGDGTTVNRSSPVREFCSATDWCRISSELFRSAAIKSNGQMWVWGGRTVGYNSPGIIGDGTLTDRISPVREFCSATDWCFVSTGINHTLAIKTSGQLWSWGYEATGRLGTGTLISRCSPVREFCSATDWCQSDAGFYHSVAVKTNGQIWTWGGNNYGQLGDGTTVNRCSPVREFCSATDWCSVNAGTCHTVAIKTSGQLWSWGRNDNGRLGDGTTINRRSPIREFCSATDWCNISAGYLASTGIKFSGQLWAWGSNNYGQLGNGTISGSISPIREFCSATDWCKVSISGGRSAAIKTNGQIWNWGRNNYGQLGDGTTVNRCSPVREFCSATDWCDVCASSIFTIAIKRSRGFNAI